MAVKKPAGPRKVLFKKREPWNFSPNLPDAVIYALRAFDVGKANENQQKIAKDWILFEACGLRELSFDPDNPRATDFAEGARSVGLKIVTAMKLNPRS